MYERIKKGRQHLARIGIVDHVVIDSFLMHHGIKGQKWGVRRFQNEDGTLTSEGKRRYNGSKYGDIRDDIISGSKNLKHNLSIMEAVQAANPLRGTKEGQGNCVPASIATFFQMRGLDLKAKGTSGKSLNLGGVIDECFNALPGGKKTILDGRATSWGNKTNAEQMLKNKVGDNAEGVVGIEFNDLYKAILQANGYDHQDIEGHAFNWQMKNGSLSVFDGQKGWPDSSFIFDYIDTNGPLTIARLDNLVPNYDELDKYLK